MMMKAEIAREIIRSRSHIERTGSVRVGTAVPSDLWVALGSMGRAGSVILSLDYTGRFSVVEAHSQFGSGLF
jgi:hypothetical protein